MRISVVIPAYNAADTIGDAIDSVLAQTRAPEEIIVVDDGSKDRTMEVVKAFGDRVRLLKKTNGGSSSARNHGIRASQNEWIAFLDSDDTWLPMRLERQCDLISKAPGLRWLAGRYETNAGEGAPRLSRTSGLSGLKSDSVQPDALSLLAQGCSLWTGTIMVRKDALDTTGLFDERQATSHDVDLWFRLAVRYPEIGFVTDPIAVYRVGNPVSLTGKAVFRGDRSWVLSVERYMQAAEYLTAPRNHMAASFATFKANQLLRNVINAGSTSHGRWLTNEFKRIGIPGISLRNRLLVNLPEPVAWLARRMWLGFRG